MTHWRRWFTGNQAQQAASDDELDGKDQAARQRSSRVARALHGSEHSGAPQSIGAFVDDLLSNDRYALLLRAETKQHLTQSQILRAVRQLDEAMALVPAGRVLLGQLAEQSHSVGGGGDVDPKLAARNLVAVEPAYLDRYCVTNELYQKFVDAGGYEQLEFWHEEALPALLDFVDRTGCPGPRYWSDGRHAGGEQQLPVVGISWFEAWAYARWVGKRLPNDAEWTKAGAWPVETAPGRIAQRRYPWGESFDVRRAHLFGSGAQGPVSVDEFPGGVSVGGIHQLIGNVWEWTATPLAELGDPSLHVSESVMSIRGGAFDTYFENHATCHYQSGEHALSRRPNIGFRLALSMRDLEAPIASAPAQPETETVPEQPEAELAAC
ncbi:MAG: formylglycine-generating enzyme family protein [Planctomycetes bacterium]|nr:formylglycine-generating enzyme family protein [Planctomycetota bacterium]